MSSYKIAINHTEPLAISDEDLAQADLKRITVNEYHLIKDGRSYHAEILEIDTRTKEVTMLLNDHMVKCKIADQLDQLLEEMDLSADSTVLDKNLTSSMPGLVLDVMVEEGQAIQEGDPMMILEAMKMENVLKAPSDGVISKIYCQKNDAVEKHQLLIEVE